MDSRQQFEAEFRKANAADPRCEWLLQMYNHGTDEDPEIDYYSLAARDAWKWWQASRASIVVDTGYLLGDGDNEDSDYTLGFNQGITKADKAIRAAGITVKGDRRWI
jgi:hypothetical protein